MTVVLHFMTVTLNHMQLNQPQILVLPTHFHWEPAWGLLHRPALHRCGWRASNCHWNSLKRHLALFALPTKKRKYQSSGENVCIWTFPPLVNSILITREKKARQTNVKKACETEWSKWDNFQFLYKVLDQAQRNHQPRSSLPAMNLYWGFRQLVNHHCLLSGGKTSLRVSRTMVCLLAPTPELSTWSSGAFPRCCLLPHEQSQVIYFLLSPHHMLN